MALLRAVLLPLLLVSSYVAALDLKDHILQQLSLEEEAERSGPGARIPVNFGSFCRGKNACDFRVQTVLAGQNVVIDSGSSSVGFCNVPTQTANVHRAMIQGQGQSISAASQCVRYGSNGQYGWTGPSFRGDISGPPGSNITLYNSVYSEIKYHVGLRGIACGQPRQNSRGFSSPVGGVFGIARKSNNLIIPSNAVNLNSWRNVRNGVCKRNQCKCNFKISEQEPNPFIYNIIQQTKRGLTKWGLTWDGSFGVGSGFLRIGANAPYVTRNAPLIALKRSSNYYQFTVTSGWFNGEQVTGSFDAIFDTAVQKIGLPQKLFQRVNNMKGNFAEVVFNFTSQGRRQPVPMVLRVPKRLVSESFVNAGTNAPVTFGLSLLRWANAITMDIGKQTFQFYQRPSPILTPFSQIPYSGTQ